MVHFQCDGVDRPSIPLSHEQGCRVFDADESDGTFRVPELIDLVGPIDFQWLSFGIKCINASDLNLAVGLVEQRALHDALIM